ncbi:MAG: GntR family transcriptional regulator [Proteobacteria bacterium]|nr:GntR family transcriptional regulator [Pseudomonadota bacterium]
MSSEPFDPTPRNKRQRKPAPHADDVPANARMSLVLGRTKPSEDPDQAGFSKARHAYAVLRGEILDGVYKPGEWLRMSHIAERLNLSEMPVREALRALEKDGLVTIHLHRGARVATLSFERAMEITEARMGLECLAAISATPWHDEISLRALHDSLSDLRRVADDLVEFAIKNRAFAIQIYAKCPNAFLREHIHHLWDQVWQYSSTAVFEVMRHRVDHSLLENAAILCAITERRPDKVQAVYAIRLQRSLDAWAKAISERESPSSRQ